MYTIPCENYFVFMLQGRYFNNFDELNKVFLS